MQCTRVRGRGARRKVQGGTQFPMVHHTLCVEEREMMGFLFGVKEDSEEDLSKGRKMKRRREEELVSYRGGREEEEWEGSEGCSGDFPGAAGPLR